MKVRIQAAIVRKKQEAFSIEEVELEEPRAGEILVRVVATGICHTDLVTREGLLPTPFPVVLGHEGAGVVEKIGPGVNGVSEGDHVVMTFNSCGQCACCKEHHITYCEEFFPRNFLASRPDGSSPLSKTGERINGNFFGQSSFATHAICHERNAVLIPKNVPLELMGPLACGFQTGAGAVLNALKVTAGKSFAVFGTGSVGFAALMAAKIVNATTIIAIDTNETRLALATTLGATHTINPTTTDVVDEIKTITGNGLNFALDTTGMSSVIRNAALSLAPMGTCGILGASAPGSEIHLDEVHFMSGGRRLMGIVEGEANPHTFIPMLIDLWRRGLFPFERLIGFYSFKDINRAVHDSKTGTTIKPVLRMGQHGRG